MMKDFDQNNPRPSTANPSSSADANQQPDLEPLPEAQDESQVNADTGAASITESASQAATPANQDEEKPESVLHRPSRGDVTIISRNKPDRNTAILPPKEYIRRQLSEEPPTPAYVNKERELILVIRGMVERYKIPEDTVLILGRADPVTRYQPDVDLTPYGAMDRGVSRSHAKLEVRTERLYVTDLGSTNGTFVSGVRLERDKPRVINKGEDLMLGRLGIQILFRN